MNVLIVEPSQLGHRLNIAGLILEAVVRVRGCRTFFATSSAAVASEQYAGWIKPRVEAHGIEVDKSLASMNDSGGWRGFWAQIPLIRNAVLRHKIDHVLVPSGDGLVQVAFASRGIRSLRTNNVEYEAMLLRGRFAYESCDTVRKKLARAAWFAAIKHSPFLRIHHMDPIIHQAALGRDPSIGDRLVSIPDPVDPIEADLTRQAARRKMGLPVEGRFAGCVGALDIRKGIDLLLRAYSDCVKAGKLSPQSDRLLLVGKLDSVLSGLLAGEMKPLVQSGAIVTIPRFVSDVEMSNAISAMDLVVTPYPLHIGSASIVIRAAAQRRPALTSDFGWLGEIVPRFQLGSICDVQNPPAFADALATALRSADDYVQNEKARRFVEYCEVGNFQSHWVQRICQRLNVAPPRITSWADANRPGPFANANAEQANVIEN